MKAKFEKYDLLHWDFDNSRTWVIFIPFAYDLGLFIASFFMSDAITVLHMAVIINFFISFTMILFFFANKIAGPQAEWNAENAEIDVVEERKNIVKQTSHPKFGNDCYSLCFRAYHKDSAA